MPAETLLPVERHTGFNYEVVYHKQHGIHNFHLEDGRTVTTVTGDSWEEFLDEIKTIDNPGDIVLTPELITAPEDSDFPINQKRVVEFRQAQLQEWSSQNPYTTLVLGTVTEGTEASDIYNSQLFIRDGAVIGRSDKISYANFKERNAFTQRGKTVSPLVDDMTAAVVCSDVVLHSSSPDQRVRLLKIMAGDVVEDDFIPDSVRTLLVSAHWAMPAFRDDNRYSDGVIFKDKLESSVSGLFENYPHLSEVVIADRVDESEYPGGPFTAHFTRKASV